MISLWWSFALTLIGVSGLVLVYRSQSIAGPLVGVAVQVLWIAYALVSSQWWFLVSAFAYSAANIYGMVKRRKHEEQTASRPRDAADEMQIQSFEIRDGTMNLKMAPGGQDSEAVLLEMSNAMGELLEKHDATNYVEFDLHKRGRPAFSVCVRRFHRPSPHDLRKQAEDRAEIAEATVARVGKALAGVYGCCDYDDLHAALEGEQ